MDFQSLLIFWVVVIILVVLAGGPVLAVLGLFFAWLAPWLIGGAPPVPDQEHRRGAEVHRAVAAEFAVIVDESLVAEMADAWAVPGRMSGLPDDDDIAALVEPYGFAFPSAAERWAYAVACGWIANSRRHQTRTGRVRRPSGSISRRPRRNPETSTQ